MRSIISVTRSLAAAPQVRRGYAGASPIVLPPLPYEKNALEPHISQETLNFHYGKHHAGYVTKLNANLSQNDKALVPLIHHLKQTKDQKNFNLAAQIWNHTFYWESMKPNGGGEPKGPLADAIAKQWGNFKNFHDEFTGLSANLFGSGWSWLVKDPKSGALKIVTSSNAETPLTDGLIPLVTCDVWEHAYYIDTRNDRLKYIDSWWKLVNWDFGTKNFALKDPQNK